MRLKTCSMPKQRMLQYFQILCPAGYYGGGHSQVAGLLDYVQKGEGSEEAGELPRFECTCWAGACLAAKQVASDLRAPRGSGLFDCSGWALGLGLQGLTLCIRLVKLRGQ